MNLLSRAEKAITGETGASVNNKSKRILGWRIKSKKLLFTLILYPFTLPSLHEPAPLNAISIDCEE